MKKTILVLDNDIQYAKKISNFGIKYLGKKYIFLFFSDTASYEKYQNKNSSAISIINIDLVSKVKVVKSDMLFILTNESKQESLHIKSIEKLFEKNNLSINYVYKYSSADSILNYCISEYEKTIASSYESKSKIYLVFSPIGRCGKTIFAYTFANELAKTKKVLYISLNCYESMGTDMGLSHVIYDFKNNKLTYDSLLTQIKTKDNLSILYGVSHPNDLSQISPEEIDKIINEISSLLNYDIIIVDSDSSYSKSLFLFSTCDKILFPTLNDEVSKQKRKRFLEFIKEQNIFDISKIQEVDMSLQKDLLLNSSMIHRHTIKKAKTLCKAV
jgi:cellulose biosynthesis protein BcsQ